MLEKFSSRDNIASTTRKLNALVDQVNRLSNIRVGDGLMLVQSAGGWGLTLVERATDPTGKPTTPKPECTGGVKLQLGFTPGTQDNDSWDPKADPNFYPEVCVLTDLKYSTITRQFTCRYRTLRFNKCGELVYISPESSELVVFTAEVCE